MSVATQAATAPQTTPPPKKGGKQKKVAKDPKLAILATVVLLALVMVVGLPTVKIITAGLSPVGVQAFLDTFSLSGGAFFNSIILGTLVGLLGTFIGFITAFAQVRLEFPGKKIVHWISLLPVISPPFAIATAIVTLFGRRGIITHQLFGLDFDIYGLHGLVIVLTMTFTPVAYMNIRGMLANLDPSHDEAAESLGYSGLGILFKVTIPMVLPALLTSFLILFVEGLADLANPLVLGGNYKVLASQIYFAVAGEGNVAKAAGISVSLLLPSLVVFFIQRYWVGRKSVVTVTGKPAGRPRMVTDKAVKIPVLIFMFAWVGLIVLMYLSVFIGGFTKILGVNNTFSLEHYEFVFNLGSSAIVTTLWMSLIAAPIAALLGLLIAWLVVRYFKRFAGLVDLFGMLGSAIPGTVLGLGFALAYSVPTWFLGHQILPPLAGGTAVGAGAIAIIMVFIARGIPTGQQANIAALRQINPQIEEAAVSLGASQTTMIRKVTFPLLVPSMVSAITFAITKSMTVITAIIFITTPQTKVMTAQILDEVDAGRLGNAFAYCTLLIVLVLIVLGITSLFIKFFTKNLANTK
ncbi:ABC transporter permease [Corynebacterium choanae]|uniref:Molybdenum transport system permease protein ModB n=1 Tax=Corynebacterium choanae TaxID=1862358 RepID=A0A3G6J592_9CORY|nr:iron ABC transporter permease [Corynebacterium choanae]AZA13109.1 Molybdenum transport system permease protein ModB [Corynebacterium choanae]